MGAPDQDRGRGAVRRLLACVILVLVACPALAGRAVVDWEYGYVNVRRGPSTAAERVGRISRGAEVETLEERRGWVRIRSGQVEGWVTARSLKPAPPSPEPVTASPPAERGEPGPASRAEEAAPGARSPSEGAAPSPPERADSPTPAGEDRGRSVPQAPEPQAQKDGAGRGYLSEYLDAEEPPAAPADGGWLRFASGLFLVLALIVGAGWAVRWLLGRRRPLGRASPGIRILATRPLGARHGLVLVEAGGLVWLLAHGPDGVRPIAEIRDPEALRRLNERYGFLESPFEARLREQMDLEQGGEGGEEPGPEPSPEERLAALRRRSRPGRPT